MNNPVVRCFAEEHVYFYNTGDGGVFVFCFFYHNTCTMYTCTVISIPNP